jgi:hypothetical protein
MRVLAATVVALIVLTACSSGGDTKPSPAANFADATCNDLARWATAIQVAFNDLQSIGALDVNDRAEVSTVFTRLETSLGGADEATAALGKGINDRPPPSISSGSDVKKTLVDGFNGLHELLSATVTKLKDTDPATAPPEQLTHLKTDLGNLEGEALARVANLSVLQDNEELRKAFEGSQTCKDASSGLVSAGS